MKINEACQCGSAIQFNSEFDKKKKDLKEWRDTHSTHNLELEPRIKGMTSAVSGAVERKFEVGDRWGRNPVVFGFVPNEVNEMMKHD